MRAQATTRESALLWRLTGESGRQVECRLGPLGTGDYQLTVLYNGLEATTEVYSAAFLARARAKQIVALLHTHGWRRSVIDPGRGEADEDADV